MQPVGWDHQLYFVLTINFCFNSYILFAKNKFCSSILVLQTTVCSWSTMLKLYTNYTHHTPMLTIQNEFNMLAAMQPHGDDALTILPVPCNPMGCKITMCRIFAIFGIL